MPGDHCEEYQQPVEWPLRQHPATLLQFSSVQFSSVGFDRKNQSLTSKTRVTPVLSPCLWHLFSTAVPGGSDDKEFACNAGDLGLIPGVRKIPLREGNGNPL